jgi:hypothetical protein
VSITKPGAPKPQDRVSDNTAVRAVVARKNWSAKGAKLVKRSAVCLAMEHHEEVHAAAPQPPNLINQAVPALLATAVIGLGGLFIQVAKLDQSVSTVAADIQELKNDSKERLSDLETRVRHIEMTVGSKK